MRLLILFVAFAACGAAQTPAPPVDVSSMKLPMYGAVGFVYNQFNGANLSASAAVPVVNNIGLYEVTSLDLFPARATINSRNGYILTTSAREGACKALSSDGTNTTLACGDAGVSFAGASASLSGGLSFGYMRSLNKSFGVEFSARGVYVVSLGGWNPIAEIRLVWKPGSK